MGDIEHPDHTGASSNPLAPWNWPDPEPVQVQCPLCHHEPDPDDGFDEGTTCLYANDKDDPCEGVYEIKET